MILSIDWDYYAGTAQHIFDSPFWGSPDTHFHRTLRWQHLAQQRGGSSFDVLARDFPLYGNPQEILRFQGIACYAALSHSDIWQVLNGSAVLNMDSHHDLYSQSGDATTLRPGNWAGMALQQQKITQYHCLYPQWHATVAVTEGYDIQRTQQEILAVMPLQDITLSRGSIPTIQPEAVVLVQSPAWCNPLYDELFFELCHNMNAQVLTSPLQRIWV